MRGRYRRYYRTAAVVLILAGCSRASVSHAVSEMPISPVETEAAAVTMAPTASAVPEPSVTPVAEEKPGQAEKKAEATKKKAVGTKKKAAKKPAKKSVKKPEYRLVARKGKTYCLTGKKKKVKNQFCKIGKRIHYFDKKGVMVYGWLKKGGNYYYLSRNSGAQVRDKEIDGIRIRKNGEAKVTDAAKRKLSTMLKAKEIVGQITRPGDTRGEKLYKCYRYIMKFGYRRFRLLKPIYRQPGWEVTFANDIFRKHMGCCVSEASALAFLTRECGYKDVYVCHDTGHAWMELNGRVYDPLFSEAKNFSRYYGRPYQGYGCHPVGKRKIG